MTYGVIYVVLRRRLSRLGRERVAANRGRYHVLSEVFGGIKQVKVAGLEEAFVSRFDKPAKRYASHQAKAQVAKNLPRFAIEAIAFGGMILVLLYLMRGDGGLQEALPIAALYALAGYRLMPALQEIYAAMSSLRFSGTALDNLHRELMDLASTPAMLDTCDERVSLNDCIRLEEVTYSYPAGNRPAISRLNLEVPARTTIALVGSTGSGKTTTVDVILGLLPPQSGKLLVDGKIISADNCRAWQKSIGYVPQQIHLSDDTLAANIAFGVPREWIDWKALKEAARVANLADFVENELAEGYFTLVGERGVRLSGGQRQRIGIARALYHQPQVLILDEATAALDNLTEYAVMEAVQNLSHAITIIMIAHRLTTVRDCDRIYLMDKGVVAACGTYAELIENNPAFRQMAQIAHEI